MTKTPLKAQLSAPVASSSSNRTSPQPVSGSSSVTAPSSDGPSGTLSPENEGSSAPQRASACDLAPEVSPDVNLPNSFLIFRYYVLVCFTELTL